MSQFLAVSYLYMKCMGFGSRNTIFLYITVLPIFIHLLFLLFFSLPKDLDLLLDLTNLTFALTLYGCDCFYLRFF